jgi:hypothetical protein
MWISAAIHQQEKAFRVLGIMTLMPIKALSL